MLKITEGSVYSEARDIIRSGISRAIAENRKAILIVPEQQTVMAEKEMAELLPGSAPLLFEVTNFTRLANSVFRRLGGVDKEYCDTLKSSLIMWRTLSELAPALSLTNGHREINYGMVKRALATSKEADSLALSEEDLELAMEKTDDGSQLSKKLSDLLKIKSLYKKLLREKYSDLGEDVRAAADLLFKNRNTFSDTLVFIEGFTSFTEPQYRMIEALISDTELTVHLDLPKADREEFVYSEIKKTEKRLTSRANKMGFSPILERFDGMKRGKESLYQISRLLWHTNTDFDNVSLQNSGELRIFEASTPYEACDFIISDIREKTARGDSYSDFAVISGDISKYSGILDVSARRAGVPLFISDSRDVSSFEAIKLIYTALACVTGGFMREDVISYAKCGLSSITREECDIFELYTEKWQINGKRFTDGIMWNMSPDGYSDFKSERTDAELLKIDKIRSRLCSPLITLSERIADAETVKDYANAVYEFSVSVSLHERISKRLTELRELGEEELLRENERIYKIICDSLDTLVEVSGDTKSDAQGFISQLKIVFGAASVSMLPSFTDTVTAGSAAMVRLSPKKHIYLLGVNLKEFPAPISSDSYFTEKDKACLAAAGLPFEPDILIKEAKSLYSFTKAFSYADLSVTLLYSTKSADYSAAKKSEVIDKIVSIVGKAAEPVKISSLSQGELIFSPSQALTSLGRLDKSEYAAVKNALDRTGHAESVRLAERRVENDRMTLSKETLGLIYKEKIELSQSKIDSYNTCPLAYFCRYNLGLCEEERAEFDKRNIGSFIHAILENFFDIASKSNKAPGELSDSEKESIIKTAAELYLSKIMPEENSGNLRTSLLLKRLIRASKPIIDGLCEEFSGSRYIPKYFELKIGGKDELSPELFEICEEGGNKTLIKGSIDRVDTYKFGDDVYVRVVDYKTGQKDFSPEDLCKGKNLQMFLYLSAVIDTKNKRLLSDIGLGCGGRLIPAGVIYVKSDLSDAKISHASEVLEAEKLKSEQKRRGMLLDDAASISAMNAAYLPIKINAGGEYSKGSTEFLYSEEGWKSLRASVEDSVRRVSGKMRSGNIFAEPMAEKNTSPCSYCKFKPMCRNAKIK